jgi:hypothetical protein
VPAVLAVFNWPKNTDRYRRVQRFTEALFTKWDRFMEPHRHPKWRDVNLAATVPGWSRWSVAEEMLSRMQKDPRIAEVQQKDVRAGEEGPALNLTQEQRETLYYEFLQWQKQRSSVQRSGSNQEQQQQQLQRAQRGLHGRGHGQQQSGTQRGGPQQKQQAAAEHRGPQQARQPSTEGRGPQQKQPLQAMGRRSPQPPQRTEGRGAQQKQQAPTTDGRGG